MLSVVFIPDTAQSLGLIQSSSISLIHVRNPLRFGKAPVTYSGSRGFSGSHPGSKTLVRATLDFLESEIHAVENGETPFYNARLEEELGHYVDLELALIARA